MHSYLHNPVPLDRGEKKEMYPTPANIKAIITWGFTLVKRNLF